MEFAAYVDNLRLCWAWSLDTANIFVNRQPLFFMYILVTNLPVGTTWGWGWLGGLVTKNTDTHVCISPDVFTVFVDLGIPFKEVSSSYLVVSSNVIA